MKKGLTHGWLNYNALTALLVACVSINFIMEERVELRGLEGNNLGIFQ